MGADAGVWLAIGSALFPLALVTVAVLCRMALRHEAEFKVEIKAPSFSLKLVTRPSRPHGEAGSPQRSKKNRASPGKEGHEPTRQQNRIN